MSKIMKDIYIDWNWEGDEYALKGFNVAITPEGSTPKNEVVRLEQTSKEKSDLLNSGTEKYEHIFREVILNDSENYIAWVQALYPNEDSDWISTSGLIVEDDGKATIATTDADENPISAGQGSVLIGSDGITIINGMFDIQGVDGNFKIQDDLIELIGENPLIKLIADNGDYSELNNGAIAFYKDGQSTPHYYSKRVAYGVAQDGDYIDLTTETGSSWEHLPKVQTAIKSLTSYHSSHSNSNQSYESYADGVDRSGFYAYGKSIIAESPTQHNIGYWGRSYETSYSDNDNITKLYLYFSEGDWDASQGNWYINIYYTPEGGSEIDYGRFHRYGSKYDVFPWSFTISGLNPDRYKVRFYLEDALGKNREAHFDYWKEYSEEVIDNGEVMWIAVEGGAD
ncbi:MAG: hypothetical protein ACOCQD_02605 [archaeon]